MSAGPILELEGINVRYEGEEVATLSGIDLDIQAGEIAAIVSIDTSGGLTTLLKVAAGLQRPTSGKVRFEGRDVYSMGYRADQKMRSRMGVVFEGGALHPNRSVWDNVAFPLRYHGERSGGDLAATVERLLADCGFNEDPRSFPWQVSARGRKLAALARALSRDPALVIVDRFFEGLEQPDWRRLFELVMELNHHQGVSWLLVSEVDAAIFQVAERVAVLQAGELIGYDYRKRLFRNDEIRDAFEQAEALPMRRLTERQAALSSEEVSLEVSSNPLDDPSGELTIVIDGRLDRMPDVVPSPDEELGGDLTIDLSPARPSLSDPAAKKRAAKRTLEAPVPSQEDPATAPEKRKRAAKRTLEAPIPSLEDPSEAAKKAAAKRTLEAPAPVLEDPAEAKRAAKRTLEAPAPLIEDPAGEVIAADAGGDLEWLAEEGRKRRAARKKRSLKRTIEAPAPTLRDPAEEPAAPLDSGEERRALNIAQGSALSKAAAAPPPSLEDPAPPDPVEEARKRAAKNRRAAKRTLEAPAPTLEDPSEAARPPADEGA